MTATRDHIIHLADALIRQKGFNAFSYADIAAVLDIRNAAIHYYFPTKSLLGQAVMEMELSRLEAYRRRNKDLGGEGQLKHLIGTFYQNAQRHAICLMGALTPEFATFDEAMQSTLRKLCTTIREWVADCLREARASGQLWFEGSPGDRAALVISTLLASLLLARIEGEDLFRRMMDRLLEDLHAGWRISDLPADVVSVESNHSFT
jgi:AcrR family transcriptional regulator